MRPIPTGYIEGGRGAGLVVVVVVVVFGVLDLVVLNLLPELLLLSMLCCPLHRDQFSRGKLTLLTTASDKSFQHAACCR
jgi:hypothetical protein